MRRIAGRLAAATLVCSTAFVGLGAPPAEAQATIHAKRIAGGLNQPAGFTFAPNGKIFYLEKTTGEIRVFNPTTGNDHLFFSVSHVNGDAERGLLGIALSSNWPTTPYLWVYATRTVSGHLRNQILRIKSGGGMQVIFSAPASVDPYHNGGRILFGPDGELYAFEGDGHDSSNSQDTTANNRGKMLRMNGDGTRPSDNPFSNLIWSYGNRNSFGFAFDPKNGNLWETENGPECNDELNRIVKGGNYGWGPNENCSGTHPDDTNNSGSNPIFPKFFYQNTIGITGMAFCQSCNLNMASEGTFFFGDVDNGRLYRATLNNARTDISGTPTVILSSSSVISLEVGPDRSIYFSDLYAGAIYKLVYS